jgi:hypothetical protein
MKFTVVAVPSVESALAKFFLEGPDPQAVTAAANWLDRELSNNPLSKVTPVDDLFFLRRNPLVVLCSISIEDRLVTIIEVNRTEEPR